MNVRKLTKYIFLLFPLTLGSCAKKENTETNIYKDLDARKMLFFNLENIKRNEKDKLSNYTNKITYKYKEGDKEDSKTYRSESNIYSNHLESTGITILTDKSSFSNSYKHAIKDDYLYTYSSENGIFEISKESVKGSDTDAYEIVNSTYLKYDFLTSIQKSSIDLIESILLLPDSSFKNLNFLDSSSSNDAITFDNQNDKYEYTLLRNSKSKINNENYELNLSIISKMFLSNSTLYSYNITYNYSLAKSDDSTDSNKDNANEIIDNDITFSLELSGNSKFERKDASEKEFEFINLANSN